MSDFVHPRWPTRHKPNITTAEIGAEVTCVCGWAATAPNPAQATAAYLEHVKTEREAS